MVSPIDTPFPGSSGSQSTTGLTGSPTTGVTGSSDTFGSSSSILTSGKMRDRIDALNQFKDRSLATSRAYVREHPMRSAVMAMAAGMLLRRMIGGRSSRTRHF
jgi:hypothetical protein